MSAILAGRPGHGEGGTRPTDSVVECKCMPVSWRRWARSPLSQSQGRVGSSRGEASAPSGPGRLPRRRPGAAALTLLCPRHACVPVDFEEVHVSSNADEEDIRNAIMAIRRNRVALKGELGGQDGAPHVIPFTSKLTLVPGAPLMLRF